MHIAIEKLTALTLTIATLVVLTVALSTAGSEGKLQAVEAATAPSGGTQLGSAQVVALRGPLAL
jgi:hypothetical protein